MGTYYDALNDAYEVFESRRLSGKAVPASAQLIFLHILHSWNCSKRTGTVRLSDYGLSLRTGLSKQTITDAKRLLKNIGLIDFPSRGGTITEYTIKIFSAKSAVGHQPCNKVGQEVGHLVGRSPLVNYGPGQNVGESEESRESPEMRGREIGGGGGAGACESKLSSRVITTWRTYNGRSLIPSEAAQVARWIDDNGEDWFIRLIPHAWDKCEGDRMTFAYLRGFVERELNPHTHAKKSPFYAPEPTADYSNPSDDDLDLDALFKPATPDKFLM